MKKSLLLLSFFIVAMVVAHAQIKRFSFKAAANYAVIPTVRNTDKINMLPSYIGFGSTVMTATLKESYESKPGFDLSTSMDYAVAPRFFLSTGLSISYLRFKKSVVIEDIDGGLDNVDGPQGNPMGSINGSIVFRDINGSFIIDDNRLPVQPFSMQTSDNGKSTTLYLQLPVLMGTTFFHDKLIVRAGVSFSYLLSASVYVDRFSYDRGIESYKDKGRDGYTSLLASGTINATYMISKSLGVDLSANKFFSPIYDQSSEFSKQAKYNTFSVGLNYTVNR